LASAIIFEQMIWFFKGVMVDALDTWRREQIGSIFMKRLRRRFLADDLSRKNNQNIMYKAG